MCCQVDWKNDFFVLLKTKIHTNIRRQDSRCLFYPGGQTQPGMHGVLGGQVRFNIRLRQVGAQATPPLCSVQLWYTFPSGHSPTSTLSGSRMCAHTQTHTYTQENQCPSRLKHQTHQPVMGTSYNYRHKALDFSKRDTAWNGTLLLERTRAGTEGRGRSAERLPFSSGTHSIFPFLHRLMEETGRERKRGRVFRKESNVIKHKVSLSALRLIWQSLKLLLLPQMYQTVCVCVRVVRTLGAVRRAAKVSFLYFSVKVKASCDSPGARGAEGHLPWLWHTTHGVTVTLRPAEKLVTLF